MRIKQIAISDLTPADYNPRKDLQPGDTDYDKLKRSLSEFGYVEPVIWNKTTGNIVGGHQRLKVLADLGYKTVDCVVVELDETREKALNGSSHLRVWGWYAGFGVSWPGRGRGLPMMGVPTPSI